MTVSTAKPSPYRTIQRRKGRRWANTQIGYRSLNSGIVRTRFGRRMPEMDTKRAFLNGLYTHFRYDGIPVSPSLHIGYCAYSKWVNWLPKTDILIYSVPRPILDIAPFT